MMLKHLSCSFLATSIILISMRNHTFFKHYFHFPINKHCNESLFILSTFHQYPFLNQESQSFTRIFQTLLFSPKRACINKKIPNPTVPREERGIKTWSQLGFGGDPGFCVPGGWATVVGRVAGICSAHLTFVNQGPARPQPILPWASIRKGSAYPNTVLTWALNTLYPHTYPLCSALCLPTVGYLITYYIYSPT